MVQNAYRLLGSKGQDTRKCVPTLCSSRKHCPDDAVMIINLPAELETDMVFYRYSLNGFRLFKLPTPSKDSVVGILGPNGMGINCNKLFKSCSNLGDWEESHPDWNIIVDVQRNSRLLHPRYELHWCYCKFTKCR